MNKLTIFALILLVQATLASAALIYKLNDSSEIKVSSIIIDPPPPADPPPPSEPGGDDK